MLAKPGLALLQRLLLHGLLLQRLLLQRLLQPCNLGTLQHTVVLTLKRLKGLRLNIATLQAFWRVSAALALQPQKVWERVEK